MFNKWIKNPAVVLLAAVLVLCTALTLRLEAQPYPINSPFYVPNPILAPVVIPTGQGTGFVYQTNGTGTLYVRIAGAPVGLVAQMQGSEARVTTTYSATVTISNASPGVVTWTNHGLSVNQPVVFTTTGGLPTGLTAGTTYYVIAAGLTSGAFEVAATPGGTAINTSSAGSGTQTGTTTSVGWTNVGVQQMGGPGGTTINLSQITGVGLYRIDSSGYAQVRLNVQALTSGTTYASFSAGSSTGPFSSEVSNRQRATYSASALIGTGATTHFWTIAGSATRTVRVTRVECGGKATAAANVTIQAEVDSTADSGDAGTAAAATPHDSNDPAATAVVLSHTTSPTPGTLVGYPRAGILQLTLTPTATDFPTPNNLSWQFGDRFAGQEMVLRGTAQSFSLNTSAAFGSGASVGCSMEWSEE